MDYKYIFLEFQIEFLLIKVLEKECTLLQVEFLENGICHGFALWIDWVMDAENNIVVSTGPGTVLLYKMG